MPNVPAAGGKHRQERKEGRHRAPDQRPCALNFVASLLLGLLCALHWLRPCTPPHDRAPGRSGPLELHLLLKDVVDDQ
eukprot:8214335-Pyramimonas_sp.AAC.1